MSLLTFSFDIFPALCILSNAKSWLKNLRWTHLSGKFNPSSNVKPSAFCYKGLGGDFIESESAVAAVV